MAIFHSRRERVRLVQRRVTTPLLVIPCMLAAALLLATTAFAGPVRGSLTVPRDAQPRRSGNEAPDRYWREWNGVLEPRPDVFDPRRELAVVLTGDASGEPIGCAFALSGGDLLPSTMAVRAGTTLRIENRDGCSHLLFAEGIDEFGRLETPPGNARAVPVGTGGPWVVRDAVHPHVEGHLHALPDLVACGTVDARGSYVFPAVPAGSYTLKVFRGAAEVASQAITVADTRELVVPPLSITLPAAR